MNDIEVNKNSKTMAILSLVFGAIAIIISWAPFGRFIVIALGIAAIVLGSIVLGKLNKNLSEKSIKSMVIAGIVLGSLAIVFSILATIAIGFVASHWLKGGNMMGQWKMLGRHLR